MNEYSSPQIPFSKFFLGYRGRIQDNQCHLWLDKVESWQRESRFAAKLSSKNIWMPSVTPPGGSE